MVWSRGMYWYYFGGLRCTGRYGEGDEGITSSRKYSCSTRLLHDPFVSSNVGPANNSGVRVSILSRFITNAEKSRGVSNSYFDGFIHLVGMSFSKVLSLWSNPNKETKLGRSCREELETIDGIGTGVCYRCVMRGVGGGGRVVADKRGGSATVVTKTSTSKADSVLRFRGGLTTSFKRRFNNLLQEAV
nr:hypothetical protein [Tanacetum cinerariifolium]